MRGTKSGGIAVAALASLALALPGAASAGDGNDDGIPDRWEREHGLSLNKDQAGRDQDRDGLRNRHEFRGRMDPRDHDSDDDGTDDGDEGTGTIASFDPATGRLRIDTFGGDTASGLVTDETEIECDREDEADEDGDGERRDGSNSGPGSGDGDDDNSGPGDGDDDNSGPGDGDDEGDEEECTTDDLVPGTVVQEAELEIEDGGAFWEEVELLKQWSVR